jgi:hypothetical protein
MICFELSNWLSSMDDFIDKTVCWLVVGNLPFCTGRCGRWGSHWRNRESQLEPFLFVRLRMLSKSKKSNVSLELVREKRKIVLGERMMRCARLESWKVSDVECGSVPSFYRSPTPWQRSSSSLLPILVGGCAGGGDEGESRAGSPTWMAGALSVGNRIFSRAPVRCVRGSWPPPAALGLCYVY